MSNPTLNLMATLTNETTNTETTNTETKEAMFEGDVIQLKMQNKDYYAEILLGYR